MCGIVGYIGRRPVVPVLISGLEKLEYRGYDSAGVATIVEGKYQVIRAEGKLGKLKDLLHQQKFLGEDLQGSKAEKIQIGIGHTRWATHGRPSETNAHPHIAGKVCVVHNGIIENYVALRDRLQKEGCKFVSETDSEIAAHLINSYLLSTKDILQAVKQAVTELQGSYALVVMSVEDPQRLVVAKNATPVIIGLALAEVFVASDIPAILEYTREIVILEDGEIADITVDSVSIENSGEKIDRKPITVTWDPITASKGGYRHFMLKEINEQPQAVSETFRGRIDQQHSTVILDGLNLSNQQLKEINRIYIVACGTARHAGLIIKTYIEKLARLPVEVDFGSEFRYRDPLIDQKTLCLAISQSGETADTLGSLNLAIEKGSKSLAICNVVGSTISRKASGVLYTQAGPEISVASTKAFVTQLTLGYLLALHLGLIRGTLEREMLEVELAQLMHLPSALNLALQSNQQIEKTARQFGKSGNFLYLGRGILYPIALEGALKLKEISYVHAEGYPAGEMKHGPIALVGEETPIVAVLGRDGQNYEKTMSNLMEVNARGGQIIAVTDQPTSELEKLAQEVISVGQVGPNLLPIVLTIPLQLLAYHVAIFRGTDVDQPRNLAKSVTVE